jgi:hypothetical protein
LKGPSIVDIVDGALRGRIITIVAKKGVQSVANLRAAEAALAVSEAVPVVHCTMK